MGKSKRKVRRREHKVRKPRAKNKQTLWKIENGKVVRTNKTCPKCGPGVYLAEHHDRFTCGRCGFMRKKSAGPIRSGKRTQRTRAPPAK